MTRFYFAACAHAAILGMATGLIAFLELLAGGEFVSRALAWPWFGAIFPVWFAALTEAIGTAKRIGYKPRFFPRAEESKLLFKAVVAGCPRWVASLCILSLVAFVWLGFLSELSRAELSDGLTSAELPVVVSVSIGFFAASAAPLWSHTGRERWAAA